MPVSRNKPAIPAIYAQIFVKIATRAGLSEQALLDDLGLSLPSNRLSGALARMSLAQYEALGLRLIDLLAARGIDPGGIGYVAGLRMALSAHGKLAFLVLSQLSVRQAIESAIRFRALALPVIEAELRVADDCAIIELRLDTPLAEALREPFFDLLATTIWRSLTVLMGRARRDVELCFDYPEPAYHAQYRSQLPRCRFNSASNQIRFPAAYLDRRMATGDTLAAEDLEDSCNRELALLGSDDDLAARIRTLLTSRHGYPDLTRVCDQLSLSPRTLKRKLQQQGTSFLLLREQARQHEASQLLSQPELAIGRIAERLGYSDPANFTAAFRKWTGLSPSAWRERHGHGG